MALIQVAFSKDTTGSVAQILAALKRHEKEVLGELFAGIPEIEIGLMVHGDDANRSERYSIKVQPLTSCQRTLINFIDTAGDTYGGGPHANYEIVLNHARRLNWKAGAIKILVIIGDEVPHGPSFVNLAGQSLNWENELDLLLEMGVIVYGVHCLPGVRPGSQKFYRELARKTGGVYLTLDQFGAVPDLVRAICYKQAGQTQLEAFEATVKKSGRMNRNMDQVFATLTGRPIAASFKEADLDTVPAGRFQTLSVSTDMAIKPFVQQQGLGFMKGAGFYQFTKAETVQSYKEVILRDKLTGDFYCGDAARKRIGLPPLAPTGAAVRLRFSSDVKYDVFIQSTSVNRKLIGGTLFLYEVGDN